MRRLVNAFALTTALLFSSPTIASAAFAAAPEEALAGLKTYGQFYVGAAPGEPALREFKNRHGGVVVDLRSLKDMDCGARTGAAKLGVPYQNVPLDTDGGISQAAVRQVEKLIADAAAHPVMLVCKTGNRAAAMLALHLASAERLNATDALARARALGLTSRELTAKVRRYLLAIHTGDTP